MRLLTSLVTALAVWLVLWIVSLLVPYSQDQLIGLLCLLTAAHYWSGDDFHAP